MEHWLPWIYAVLSLASGIVTAFSLRRFGRAIAWNVYLKTIGVPIEKRRKLALITAKLDLKIPEQPDPVEPAPALTSVAHEPSDAA
jgi:hypothetical protein